MRKILSLLLCALLSSCRIEENAIDYSTNEKLDSYEVEYPDSFISWNDLLTQKCDEYFVYVFAYDCYYCNEIKGQIVSFYNSTNMPLLLVEYNKSIPIEHNTDKTIGKTLLDDIFIRGTPTLILINKGAVFINAAGKKEVLEIIDLYKNQ